MGLVERRPRGAGFGTHPEDLEELQEAQDGRGQTSRFRCGRSRLSEGLDKRVGGFTVTQISGRRVTLARKFDEVQEAADDLDGHGEPERYQGC